MTLADDHDCTHRIAVVSGYFNPVHVGHLRMMIAAKALADHLVVIVNNDMQQMIKKGRIILPMEERLEIVRAFRVVDHVVPARDSDAAVRLTLQEIRQTFPHARIIFANGGDRSDMASVAEASVCDQLDIEMAFGVGGEEKADSSSRINDLLDEERGAVGLARRSDPAG